MFQFQYSYIIFQEINNMLQINSVLFNTIYDSMYN